MNRRPLHILIGEDDTALANLYAAYAKRRGHTVTVARDGAETLLAAAASPPDVLLLDVAMPKLDGRDVLRELKAHARTKGIPVLVISAHGGDQNMRDNLLELGAWDVLDKPVDLDLAFTKAERLAERAAGKA